MDDPLLHSSPSPFPSSLSVHSFPCTENRSVLSTFSVQYALDYLENLPFYFMHSTSSFFPFFILLPPLSTIPSLLPTYLLSFHFFTLFSFPPLYTTSPPLA